jgi:predicted methyltransferase
MRPRRPGGHRVPLLLAAFLIPFALALLPAAPLAAAAAPPGAAPQPQPSPPPHGAHDATAHHPFTNVERWVKVFDDPARNAWQKPQEVVAALGLKPGMIVADLGAGTGYFEPHLAKAVAPRGMVLAIDTEPEMVRHLGERARQAGLAGVLPVLALPDDPFLPRGSVDLVLIVDTYHHIDDRLQYFGRLREGLAPGGRVAVIDFHKRPLPVGPPPEHKLERSFVVNEMRAAGWTLAGEPTFLPYQYFLIFTPAASGSRGAR